MARTDHLHKRHRGLIPADQLASGTSSAGRVPVADGAGSQAWTAPFSLTVKEQDGTPSVANVTEIRVSNATLTNEGSGAVSISTGGGGGGAGGWEEVSTTGARLEAGRTDIWDADELGEIFMDAGFISVVSSGAAIELAPDNGEVVDIVSGDGLLLPVQAADPTAVRDGHIYYDSATDVIRLRANGAWVSLAAGTTVATDTIWDAAGDLVQGTGANTAARLAITVPAANILNVLGVVNGETTWSVKSIHDGTAPAAVGTAAAGSSLFSAHRDHVHALTTVAADCSADVDLPADTPTDITGCSISLVAGTWEISAIITYTADTGYALQQITDSSNVVFGEGRGAPLAASETTWPVGCRVTPGSTTTYKLRAQTNGATNVLKFGAGVATGTRIWALKVG